VRIDLHHEILVWRQELARRGLIPWTKRFGMKLLGIVLRFNWLYRLAGWLTRRVVPLLPRQVVYARWNVWGRQRELPAMPPETFRELYRRYRGQP
jgi:L-lactate dehydrogenase complex protein LldF